MTNVLITGCAGFVGSHLVEYLFRNTHWHLFGLMRWNESLDNLEPLIHKINQRRRIELIEGDLTDSSSVANAVRIVMPDYIFHLAAQSYVTASFTSPIWTLETNVIGTANLLEAVRIHAPDAFVHNCSSSEVYGCVPSGTLIDENCALLASSPYSASKIGADVLGQFYARAYGLRVLTTRMFTHTGPRRGDVFMESSFAKQLAMIEYGQLEPPLRVGNLASVRTVADVRDAVRAYYMLLTVEPIRGEVYNIGGNHTCTAEDVLRELFDIAGFTCETTVDQTRLRPLDIVHQIPDCTKFTSHTGWVPEIPFRQTMADLLDYWRMRAGRRSLLQR